MKEAIMDELIESIHKENERVKGQLRIMACNHLWLKRGDVIRVLDRNINETYVESLCNRKSGWLWNCDIQALSEKVEGGV